MERRFGRSNGGEAAAKVVVCGDGGGREARPGELGSMCLVQRG